MVNQTTTMMMNIVQKSCRGCPGMTATATATMTGSVRYAKVRSAGLNVEILKGVQNKVTFVILYL